MLYDTSNIRIELDDLVATLWLDRDDSAVNRFDSSMLDELERGLCTLQQLPCLDVLVVRSAKPGSFSPGFDLHDLATAPALVEQAQRVTDTLHSLRPDLTKIAVVDGECRSFGLELALACDVRFAVARPETAFAFPEVTLGLSPFAGATVRLPKLIGLRNALRMLLEGGELTTFQARSHGLVDEVCDARELKTRLQAVVDRAQDSPRPLAQPRRLRARVQDATWLGRWLTLRSFDEYLADIDDEQRPAARAILGAVWAGMATPASGYAAERAAFERLRSTETARTALEQARLAQAESRIYPEPINPVPAMPERLAVVGGGELGSALAAFFALNGRDVVLQEYCEETLALATSRLDGVFAGQVAQGRVSRTAAEQAKKNIRKTANWNGFDKVQWVIEAVEEDIGIKRGVLQEIERHVRSRTIIATTSSTLRIETLQAEMQRPARLAGMHVIDASLHNPLVEIVRAPATDSLVLATLCSWLRGWGKLPLVVGDRPGRLATRVRLAYLSEAVQLVAEGLPPESIDRDMRRFGMPAGPLETIDAIGFDNLARLAENLQVARGDRFARNLSLERMRGLGMTGRESGEGFYRYRGDSVRPNHLARMINWNDSDEDVISHYVFDPEESLAVGVERLVLRTINEAAAALAEESDLDPGLIDLGLARGIGWAPHRGGPLQYADSLGLAEVVERLDEFAERFGRRFEPCVELQRRAEAGESFYGSQEPVEACDDRPRWRMAG